ncbi:MAG: hypothetical protein KAG26_01700, partial [Methylococcales bacterium]|nr:hypothetical protein [Methylococcales bacterium]
VNATQKASEAAKVVDDTGLVKNSGKAVKGTKTVEKVTKTAADTMAEDEKKENGDTKTSSTEKTEDDVKNKTEAPAADTAPKAVVGSEPAATTPEK